MIGADELFTALRDAIAISQEFDVVEERLAAHGLEAEAVCELLFDRWEVYSAQMEVYDEETMIQWMRAYLEGLLTALRLPSTCAA